MPCRERRAASPRRRGTSSAVAGERELLHRQAQEMHCGHLPPKRGHRTGSFRFCHSSCSRKSRLPEDVFLGGGGETAGMDPLEKCSCYRKGQVSGWELFLIIPPPTHTHIFGGLPTKSPNQNWSFVHKNLGGGLLQTSQKKSFPGKFWPRFQWAR